MHNPFDYLALVIIFLTQWCLSRQLLKAARRRYSRRAVSLLRAALAAFYILMAAAFSLGISVVADQFNLPAAFEQIAGAVAQIWLFGSTAGYLLYLGWRLLARRVWRSDPDPARRHLIRATGGVLMAAPFALVGYGTFVERLRFRVREVDIPIPHLPGDLVGLRLAQVSDIHLSAFLSEKDLARVIDCANGLRPHVALVTGDLITDAGDPLDACLQQLARLRAEGGILACMGNHEYYARLEDYAERQGARLGIRFLRRQAVPLRFGRGVLNVAGVDYQRSGSHYLHDAERLVLPGACNVLLSHNPDVFPVAARQGYDLTVSGHTHGGQVSVEILHQQVNPARFTTPYVYGLYREKAAAYVTRGIGTIGIPARIGAPPEIALLRLRKA